MSLQSLAVISALVLCGASLFNAYDIAKTDNNTLVRRDARSAWDLVFSDDFSGNLLDTSKWEYQDGCGDTYGKGQLQCYEGARNVKVQNGMLVINASTEGSGPKEFSSGRIRQTGNGILYGKFVFRARLPSGRNLWPGLWLKGKEGCYNEVDVLEIKGEEPSRLIFTAFHGADRGSVVKHGTAKRTGIDYSRDFHDFEVQWSPELLGWYVDDVLHYKVDLSRESWGSGCSVPPFNQPENIIINLAVGGSMFNFAPLSIEEARQLWVKSTLEIDFVKVYKLK